MTTIEGHVEENRTGRLTVLVECAQNLISRYKNLLNKNSNEPIFRIENEVFSKEGQVYFEIQVIGKNQFFRMHLDELISDDQLLSGFSPIDVKRIFTKSQDKNKIIGLTFSPDSTEVLLEEARTKKVMRIDVDDSSRKILKDLPSEDIFLLGFLSRKNEQLYAKTEG